MRAARLRGFLSEQGRAAGLPLSALLLVAVALHVGVTLQAVNPVHADEHFQILEFAWARAGLSPLSDLPWEFPARIRPTIQQTLALGVLSALRAVGVESPYPWVLVLRLGSLALALSVLVWVCGRVSPGLGRAGQRALWLSALFLWFLPLLVSRFTSENWGGLALVAAITLLVADPRRGRDYAIGVLLGLAFILRFQMAFACVALVLWLALRSADGCTRVARVIAGALPVVALGSLCDAWFYRAWVFTPWESLRTNLIEGFAAKYWGTSSWYWYLTKSLWMAPPLALAVGVLCAVAILRHPGSPWVWAPLVFVLGHSLIAHKELRFLSPLIYTLPVLIALGVDALAPRAAAARVGQADTVGSHNVPRAPAAPRWRGALGWALVGQSAVLAALLLSPSVHRGKEFDWHFYRFLWKTAEARPRDTLYVLQSGEGPYRVWNLECHVYRHKRVRGIQYGPDAIVDQLVPVGTPPEALLLVTRDRRPPRLRGADGFELVYAAESGYRRMARMVGLEHTAFVRWLEQVDGWSNSQRVRWVYRVNGWVSGGAAAAAKPTS